MTSAADIARGATIRPKHAMLDKSDAVSAFRPRYGGSTTAVGSARSCASRSSIRLDRAASSVINSASLIADDSARMALLSARQRSSAASTATSSRSSADTLVASTLVSPASRSSQRASMAACSVARRDWSSTWKAAAHSRKERKAEAIGSPEVAQERVDPSRLPRSTI